MDTGMRLLRFVVQEAGEAFKVKIGKISATLIVVALGLGLTFSQGLGGEGGLRIWPLFGTTNQLLASLSLSIIAVILMRKGRNPITALVPLVIIFIMALWAAIVQLGSFANPSDPDWMLFSLDVIIIVASVWVAVEAISAMRKARGLIPEDEDADAELADTRAS
jgi:carbon starvation protein